MTDTIDQIPEFVQVRAAKLGLVVVKLDLCEPDPVLDLGSFDLRYAQSGECIWSGHGLPIEGILDAMNCFERELELPEDKIGEAWTDFGARWA